MIKFNKADATTSGKQETALLEKARYPAKITFATIKTSQAGNKYISLKFEIVYQNRTYNVWDTIVDSDKEFIMKKNSCFINALPNEIADGTDLSLEDLTKIIINKEMVVNVDIAEAGEYPAKNTINVWDMPYSKIAPVKAALNKAAEDDNDVPFFINDEDKTTPYGGDDVY